MHDDDGLIPKNGKDSKVVLRHFERPVSIRELLHSTLDRLLNELMTHQEACGVVAVTCMDGEASQNPMAGRTVLLALDLDPQEADYEGLGERE